MRVFLHITGFIIMTSFFSGCAMTNEGAHLLRLKTPDHQILYNLMAERCSALGRTNKDRLKTLYTEHSTEPDWLYKNVFPVLDQWPARYKIREIKKMTIVGQDAAARYVIYYSNNYKNNIKTVDVLYEKENGQWKIDSVTIP